MCAAPSTFRRTCFDPRSGHSDAFSAEGAGSGRCNLRRGRPWWHSVAAAYAFLQLVIYIYRAVSGGNHATDWIGAAAALGVLIAAGCTAVILLDARDTANRLADREASAATLAQITQRQWFGPGDRPKAPYHRLLAYSAVRMYELPANGRTSFRYAISAGNFVLLVHEATDARIRPSLSGQLQSWRTQLGSTARVEAFVVLPGGRPPRLSSVDRRTGHPNGRRDAEA